MICPSADELFDARVVSVPFVPVLVAFGQSPVGGGSTGGSIGGSTGGVPRVGIGCRHRHHRGRAFRHRARAVT